MNSYSCLPLHNKLGAGLLAQSLAPHSEGTGLVTRGPRLLTVGAGSCGSVVVVVGGGGGRVCCLAPHTGPIALPILSPATPCPQPMMHKLQKPAVSNPYMIHDPRQ